MSTPGFAPHTLDAEGEPSWLVELASEDPSTGILAVRLSPDVGKIV